MPRPQKAVSLAVKTQSAQATGVVHGTAVLAETAAAQPLNLRAGDYPRFLLTHRPERWDYFPQAQALLPDFGVLRISPGLNRVDHRGDPSLALVELAKQGGVSFQDAEVQGGYLRRYPMRGGPGFLPRWIRVRMTGKTVEQEVDWAEYAAVASELLEKGKLQFPTDITLRSIRLKYVDMQRIAKTRNGPHAAEELALYSAAIASIDEALSGVEEAAPAVYVDGVSVSAADLREED